MGGGLTGRSIAIAVLLGVALVLGATRTNGLTRTGDSEDYLAAGASLAAGRGYLDDRGEPFSLWPPLFPTAIAGLRAVGLEPAPALRWVNAALFGALLATFGVWTRRHVQSAVLGRAALVAMLVSFPLVYVHVMLWSEPLFCLLVAVALLLLDRYQAAPRGGTLAALGIVAALAALQRYTGVALILTCGVVLLRPRTGERLGRAIGRAALFGVAASLPLAAWLGRNLLVVGRLTGDRPESARPLGRNALALLDLVDQWFVPFNAPLPLKVLVGLAAFLLLLGPAVVALHRLADAQARTTAAHEYVRSTAGPALFLWLHSGLLVVSLTLFYQDFLYDRFMAPVYAPGMFLVFVGLDRALDAVARAPTRAGRLRRVALPAALALWLAFPALRLARTIQAHQTPGHDAFTAAVVTVWSTPAS